MINLLATIVILAIPAYVLFQVVLSYSMTPGTGWARLSGAFRNSATIAWTRVNTLSIAAIGLIGELSPLIGAPGIKDTIAPYLAPEYMVAYTLFVLIGAEIARRRTLA